MLVISCHADTGFRSHRLRVRSDGTVRGNLDNFAGVHAVMTAYFSGRMNVRDLRIELTEGEETDFGGARRVARTLRPEDMVIVVDVTGVRTRKDFTIEKCEHESLRQFLESALQGMRYSLYTGCPDPIANEDETDVYREVCTRVCFIGIPCVGGDYNDGPVRCRLRSIQAVSEALCRLAEAGVGGRMPSTRRMSSR